MNEKGPTYRLGSLNEVNDSQCTKMGKKYCKYIKCVCMIGWKIIPKGQNQGFLIMLILAFEVNYSN